MRVFFFMYSMCTTRGTKFVESQVTQDCNEYWQSQWPLWVSVLYLDNNCIFV